MNFSQMNWPQWTLRQFRLLVELLVIYSESVINILDELEPSRRKMPLKFVLLLPPKFIKLSNYWQRSVTEQVELIELIIVALKLHLNPITEVCFLRIVFFVEMKLPFFNLEFQFGAEPFYWISEWIDKYERRKIYGYKIF